jgi:hypothetical protein
MKSKGTASVADFDRPGIIFDEENVVRLLRAAVESDGSPSRLGEAT